MHHCNTAWSIYLAHKADWHKAIWLGPAHLFSIPEPEKEDPPELGDPNKVPSEEDIDASQEKRSEAMVAMSDGDLQKAVDLFTEAIKLNPGMYMYTTSFSCFERFYTHVHSLALFS